MNRLGFTSTNDTVIQAHALPPPTNHSTHTSSASRVVTLSRRRRQRIQRRPQRPRRLHEPPSVLHLLHQRQSGGLRQVEPLRQHGVTEGEVEAEVGVGFGQRKLARHGRGVLATDGGGALGKLLRGGLAVWGCSSLVSITGWAALRRLTVITPSRP